jgi:putative endonuclease
VNGAQAEHWAENYLLSQGLKLIARNYRGRFGEIDLIMQDKEVLVFVEVRQRSSSHFGGAAASIDHHKQKKLIRTAQQYLGHLGHTPLCRFDAVLMKDADGRDVVWVKNAFDA